MVTLEVYRTDFSIRVSDDLPVMHSTRCRKKNRYDNPARASIKIGGNIKADRLPQKAGKSASLKKECGTHPGKARLKHEKARPRSPPAQSEPVSTMRGGVYRAERGGTGTHLIIARNHERKQKRKQNTFKKSCKRSAHNTPPPTSYSCVTTNSVVLVLMFNHHQ